ncbi:MAG: YfjI family protein [Vulcanimicrobiota bacterium]
MFDKEEVDRASDDQLDRVYTDLRQQLTLSDAHRDQLRGRGLSDQAIQEHAFCTMHEAASVRGVIAKNLAERFRFWQSVPGLFLKDGHARIAAAHGLCIFLKNLGGQTVAVQIRRDDAEDYTSRYYSLSSTKYGGPSPGAPASFWTPVGVPSVPGAVRICEGAFKALVAAERTGVAGIAAGAGVGSMASGQIEEMLREMRPSKVYFAPDQDVHIQPEVARRVNVCLGRMLWMRQEQGFELFVETWGDHLAPELRPKGIDDALAAGMTINTVDPEAYRRCLPFVDCSEIGAIGGDMEPDNQLRWEKPVPLDAPVIKPKFPIHDLPDLARNFALAVAEAYQVPISYAASLILGTASIASLKRQVVDAGRGNTTALNEWFLTTLESGSGKSQSMHTVLAPVYAYERKLVDRAEVPEGQTNEVGMVSSDPTPESLEKRLRSNDGRFGVCNSEAGDLLSITAGRYTSSGSGSGANLGIFLKGYSGEIHRSDRVLRGATYIEEPRITMVLALQPSAFERFCASPEMRERGFWARFLLDYPDSLLGYRKSEPKPLPVGLRGGWHSLITYLLGVDPKRDDEDQLRPYVIPVSTQGGAVLKKFQEWAEVGLQPEGYWECCREFGARAREHVIKLAGLLHILGRYESGAPWEYPITAETVESAIRIFSYYSEHVRVASGSAAERRRDVRLEYVLEKVRSKPEWRQSFKARALWQLVKGRGGIQSMDDLKNDLNRLEEHGFIRLLEGKGRSLSYLVSPYLHSEKPSQRPQSQPKPFATEIKSGGNLAPSPSPMPENGGESHEMDSGFEGEWGQLGTPAPPDLSHTPKASYENGGTEGAFPTINSPEFRDEPLDVPEEIDRILEGF